MPDNESGAVDPDAPINRGLRRAEVAVLAVIALGGILGAEARYGIDTAIAPNGAGFPWATLIINLSGCMVMGALMVVLTEFVTAHRLLRPFLGIGVLGGFTTFSAFTVDTVRLLDAHHSALALVYVVATLVGGAAALAVATVIARRLGRPFEPGETGGPGGAGGSGGPGGSDGLGGSGGSGGHGRRVRR